MNIIEAFFISLSLDTKDYEKKRKEVDASLKKFGEASDKQTKLIAESGKKAAGAFSALKVEILGALAAFGMGAGFKAFIQDSMNMQAAAGRQAAALGVSANSLQVWKQMAVEMGESGEVAVGTLNAVAQGMANARQGNMDWFTTAMRFGVKGLSLNDSTDSALAKINEAAYRIKEKYGAPQAVNFLQQLGIGDLGEQTRLMESPAQRAADRANAAKHSIQLTQAEIDLNQQLQKQLGDLRGDFGKLGVKIENKLLPLIIKLGKEFENWLNSIDWDKVIKKIGEFLDKLSKIVDALGGVKGILIEIAAIKIFGWIANIGMWVLKLRSLTTALAAARAAAAAEGAAGAAGGAATAAAEGAGAGIAARAVPLATRLSMWALPIWALFHSESTGGKRRADGTYEDEVSSAQLAATAKAAREMQAKHRDQALAYFTSHGWTPQQAAGIVANLTAESGLRTNTTGDNGQAYGIAQWHKDRQAAFEKFTGHSIRGSTLAEQLAFVNHELQTSEKRAGDRLHQTDSAYSAGALVSMLYERPAAAQAEAARRAAMAQQFSSAYVGAPRGTQAKTTTNTSTVTINGPINVNAPKATNANGVAMGMKKALRDNPLIAGSVTALA